MLRQEDLDPGVEAEALLRLQVRVAEAGEVEVVERRSWT
jgi:hypothetical protein